MENSQTQPSTKTHNETVKKFFETRKVWSTRESIHANTNVKNRNAKTAAPKVATQQNRYILSETTGTSE